MNPYIYGHLIFKKVLILFKWGRNNFSTNGARMTESHMQKRMKFLNSHYLVTLNMRELGVPTPQSKIHTRLYSLPSVSHILGFDPTVDHAIL